MNIWTPERSRYFSELAPAACWWPCCTAATQTCDTCAGIPETLHGTIASGTCASINGFTFTLTWSASAGAFYPANVWQFSNGTQKFYMACTNFCGTIGSGCRRLSFVVAALGTWSGCSFSPPTGSGCALAGCTCSPLNVVFGPPTFAVPNLTFTITE